MGNAESQVAKHRKRPSVHSGSLYIPAPAPGCHSPFTSADFDKSNLELKENLPEDLKVYCNSIEIMYRFWCSQIETLSVEQYKQAAIRFYVNAFKRMPETRHLFSTKNMELQAKQFFGMFRWLVTNLRQPDSQRLVRKMKRLGVLHEKMNIKQEWYSLFLKAFHETMVETVKDKYTARIRFCMEQLYTVVMNIMLNNDFESLSSGKIAKLLKSLDKLESCLHDDEASAYLELYMRQQFCVELILFYYDCRRFKECPFEIQRERLGARIVKKYIDENAECEINVSYDSKATIYERLQENENMYELDIFDQCIEECMELMDINIWNGFKRSIMRMAVDADVHYEEQRNRARSNLEPKLDHIQLPKLDQSSVSISCGTPCTADTVTPCSPPSLCTSQSSYL